MRFSPKLAIAISVTVILITIGIFGWLFKKQRQQTFEMQQDNIQKNQQIETERKNLEEISGINYSAIEDEQQKEQLGQLQEMQNAAAEGLSREQQVEQSKQQLTQLQEKQQTISPAISAEEAQKQLEELQKAMAN